VPYSVTIETHTDEIGDGWNVETNLSPAEFVAKARHEGGVMLPFHSGIATFLLFDEFRQLWFDDGSEHVCEHCRTEPAPPKDLTVN
jgi:hypothetical protein